MIAPDSISYKLLGDQAVLLEAVGFNTGIEGVNAKGTLCELSNDGVLIVKAGFTWDFGTWAIDTPDVVMASLLHDAMCNMTNDGVLPWKYRKTTDKLYRNILKEKGMGFFRRWLHYTAVRVNSLIASAEY